MDLGKVPGLRHKVDRLDGPESAPLKGLLSLWEGRCGDRRMPDRADFDLPFDLRDWMQNVLLIDVLHDPLDFRSRLAGAEVERIEERRHVGKRLSEAGFGPLEPDIRRLCEAAAAGRRQSVIFRVTLYAMPVRTVESLYLPLTRGGEEAAMILCAMWELDRRTR